MNIPAPAPADIAREKLKVCQRAVGVTDDGEWGPISQAALNKLRLTVDSVTWHNGPASSFADPADIAAFRRCKAQGKSDQVCFGVGDNGIGKWGADTTANVPMCALPPEDWQHLAKPAGTRVEVTVGGKTVICQLQDTMPARANVRNGAVIDLNAAAWKTFGFTPPVMEPCVWRWAT